MINKRVSAAAHGIMSDTPSLFVWRDERKFVLDGKQLREFNHRLDTVDSFGHLYANAEKCCPFCSFAYKADFWGGGQAKNVAVCSFNCTRCGFRFERDDRYVLDYDAVVQRTLTAKILKELSINDSELGLSELGTHLKRRFSDIYALDPRRFEELVADIFRNLGYHVRLTQQTRDGGIDIVLLERSSGEQIIVECKRWSKSRKIAVDTVRQLIGVQLLHNYRRAKIVTTTSVTKDAINEAALAAEVADYEIDFVDGARLLQELDLYNTTIPPEDVHRLLQNKPEPESDDDKEETHVQRRRRHLRRGEAGRKLGA